MGFFTKDEWNSFEKYNGQNEILRWAEVPQKIIFFLTSIQEVENSKYNSYTLIFKDDKGVSYQAFAPSHFISEIRKNRKNFHRPYFVSHGLIDRGDNKIANFEIHYKIENKTFSIFD